MSSHFQILIVGGGNAGISVASQLLIKNRKLNIAIVEPSSNHYYQPAWTLVGGGVFDIGKTKRNESDVMPKGAIWIKFAAAAFQPDQNTITLENLEIISYTYLIITPAI